MEDVMENGFYNLTMDEQTETNGGSATVLLAIAGGAIAVIGAYGVIREMVRDKGTSDAYKAGYGRF